MTRPLELLTIAALTTWLADATGTLTNLAGVLG